MHSINQKWAQPAWDGKHRPRRGPTALLLWHSARLQKVHGHRWASRGSLEKGMAPHSSILAWGIQWTEEPGGLQSMRLQRVRHDWAINTLSRGCPRVFLIWSATQLLKMTTWMLEIRQYVRTWYKFPPLNHVLSTYGYLLDNLTTACMKSMATGTSGRLMRILCNLSRQRLSAFLTVTNS